MECALEISRRGNGCDIGASKLFRDRFPAQLRGIRTCQVRHLLRHTTAGVKAPVNAPQEGSRSGFGVPRGNGFQIISGSIPVHLRARQSFVIRGRHWCLFEPAQDAVRNLVITCLQQFTRQDWPNMFHQMSRQGTQGSQDRISIKRQTRLQSALRQS